MSEQNKNNENAGIAAFVIAIVALILFQRFFGDDMARLFLSIKKTEIDLVKLFFTTDNLDKYENLILTQPISFWNFDRLITLGDKLFWFIALPVGLIFAGLCYQIYKRGPIHDFSKKYNMTSLANSQIDIWPWVAPVINRELIKEPIHSGIWAMSKTVKDFVKNYNLLDTDGSINTNRANRLFFAQLGKLWNGVDKLKPYERALFAAFIAHGCGDKDAAVEGLRNMSLNFKNPNYDWVDGLLQKHLKNEAVQKMLKRHAYVATMLCSCLEYARTTSVLPSCYFIWLKPNDRSLWYSLNGVGRRVAFSEVAGVYAHWQAEKVADAAIEKPYVKEAVDGLKEAIKFVKFD